MNNTALAVRTDTMDDLMVIREQAALLLKSGFLPQAIKTPEQALAIIITGRELGIGAMAALNNISVIQGKPTVSPQLMLALLNRSGQVEDIKIETGKDGATCTIKRRGRTPYTARFGPAEAAAMGLAGKDNYKKQPATMYKWRAVADACRFTFSDVILGLYTHDEMDAQTDAESGELIEAAPANAIPEPPAYMRQPHTLTSTGVVGTEPPDDPPIHLDAADVENEPEPVRPVRLEGAQPTKRNGAQSSNGTVRAIMSLAEYLGWDGRTLASEVYEHPQLRVSISEEDPARSLEAMDKLQLKTLLQVLQLEKSKMQEGTR